MRTPTTWTNTRNEALRTLVLAGHTAAEIAATLGTTPEAVKSQRRRLGITATPKRPDPAHLRVLALVRMIERETYAPRTAALRRRLLGALAAKYGVGR